MHNNIKQPKTKTNQKVIRDNNVKKCLKCLDVSRHRDASFSPHFRISVCLFFVVLFVLWKVNNVFSKTWKNQAEVPFILGKAPGY